jgi:hypothetical protein
MSVLAKIARKVRSIRPWHWQNAFSVVGRVLVWVALLFLVPPVVEALAAAHLTPAAWGQLALYAGVFYLAGRLVRWVFRLGRPHPPGTGAVAKIGPADGIDLSKARHESAHAVVAHNLGVRVNLVTIVPDYVRGSGGRNEVDWNSRGPRRPADALFDLMTVCIASAIAEQDQMDAAAQYSVGPDEDVTRTVVAATRIVALGGAPTGFQGPLSVDQLVAGASEKARSMLSYHAAAVDVMTAALLSERTLAADRVAQLAGGARSTATSATLA